MKALLVWLLLSAADTAGDDVSPSDPVAIVAYLPEWRYEGANWETISEHTTHLLLFSLEMTAKGKIMAMDRFPRKELYEQAREATRKHGTALMIFGAPEDGFDTRLAEKSPSETVTSIYNYPLVISLEDILRACAMSPAPMAALVPVLAKPVETEPAPGVTCLEYFKQGTTSFSLLKTNLGAARKRTKPVGVKEHIVCTAGSMDVTYEGGSSHIDAGEAVLLPGHLVVDCNCEGSFAIVATATDAEEKATVVKKVDVVDAPGITISEHFGKVASNDGAMSLARAVVKGASEEAFQAPLFDEFVVCDEGSIEFLYGESRLTISPGEGVFLPKSLRVKWIWPTATQYTVLCLPAFSPELSGREADVGATVAKDSASMARLEALHKGTA
eukprot:s41_g10.t2